MSPASQVAAGRTSSGLASKLWPVSFLRGVGALALGAYAVWGSVSSPAEVARAVSLYWIFDGLVALWTTRFAATLATTRVLLVVRAVVGIGAGLVLLGLPLTQIYGEWRPGQLMLFIVTVVPALAVTALQIIMTAAVDLMIGLAVRRRVPGEWSVALAAVVSLIFSCLVAIGFFGRSPVPGHILPVVGIAGGLIVIVAAFRLRAVGSS